MKTARSIGAIAGAALLLLACSSSSSDSGPTLDSACNAFAAALCGTTQTCSASTITLGFGSLDACTARLVTACHAAANAPSTGVTPTKIQSCADAQKNLACGEFYKTGISSVCPTITGSLTNGSPCADDGQCESGFCTKAVEAQCGTCAAAPAVGGACANGKCPSGLRCNSSNVCAAAATSGQACTSNVDCEGDLTCNSGKCGKPAQAGEACALKGDTAPQCDPIAVLWCNPIGGKCEAVKTAVAGGTCGVDTTSGALTVCDASTYCQIVDAKLYKGICVARVADNSACKSDALGGGETCQALAVCDNGVCKGPDGTACNK